MEILFVENLLRQLFNNVKLTPSSAGSSEVKTLDQCE